MRLTDWSRTARRLPARAITPTPAPYTRAGGLINAAP
jgi:hypothetical protein